MYLKSQILLIIVIGWYIGQYIEQTTILIFVKYIICRHYNGET